MSDSIYELDFHGKHTVATGMLNSALTAVSAAIVAHVILKHGCATALQTSLTMLAITILGIIGTLGWGTFKSPMGYRVGYRVATWGMVGAWSMYTAFMDWTLQNIAVNSGSLAAFATTVGLYAWFKQPDPEQENQGTEEEDEDEIAASMARDDLAGEWIDRIHRVLKILVDITAIEPFSHKSQRGEEVGYTLEVKLPAGGNSWRDINQGRSRLSDDLDLPPGCDIAVEMGATRRTALVHVTTIDVLKDDIYYKLPKNPTSIREPLIFGIDRRNRPAGPIVREKNIGVFGEGGSGKSNAGKLLAMQYIAMSDTHLCTVDMTGLRFSLPFMQPWIDGEISIPPIFWIAFDPREAWLMFRALNRAAIARNNNYNKLKKDMDMDLMPISEHYPLFEVMVDETKYITSREAMLELFELFAKIVEDHRDPGVRATILALRGTDDIVRQKIQAQLHVIGALKATSNAELRAGFSGGGRELQIEDAPYPGCMQLRQDSAAEIKPIKVYRVKPSHMEALARLAADWQPTTDPITALAMDGRDINGNPFDDLEEGELDCMSTRWERFRAYLGGDAPKKVTPVFDATSFDLSGVLDVAGTAKVIEEAQQRNQETAESNEARIDEIEQRIAEFDIEGTLASILGSEPPKIEEHVFDVLLELIKGAGSAGIAVSTILRSLADRGTTPDRATVYKWLNRMVLEKWPIERRADRDGARNGKWYHVGE